MQTLLAKKAQTTCQSSVQAMHPRLPSREALVTRTRRRSRLCRLRVKQIVRALNENPGDDLARRLVEADALKEAAELYQDANEMARQQVLNELMQMQMTDSAQPQSPPLQSSHSSSRSSAPPGSVRRVPASPILFGPLKCFWVEQGMTESQADKVAKEMMMSGSRYCDVQLLTAQVQRLGRIIPGRVLDMVLRDINILEASPGVIAQHFVQLVQLFPGDLDVSQLACKQPKLLYCDDLIGHFDAVVNKLAELHPSHSRDEARQLLVDYPDLVFRMAYYMHVRTLDELPLELQNSMIYTGQGLAHLHQMYSKSISPRFPGN